MAATDKVKLNELSPTLSTTIVGTDATSISVDVSAYGDGLYEVEFVGTGHTSSGPELLWQANGAGLTSPNGVYLQAPAGVLSDNVETVGMFFNNIFVNNADTTLRVWGTFSSRNNKLSGYDSTGFGKAGATVGSVMIGGYHTPAAVLTSIGLLATNFDATDRIKVGSVLRVRKIGS